MTAAKKLASIYDLAKATGVSYSTVSRVLNGCGRISEATRRKILAAAEKSDFKPKMQARRLTVSLVFGFFHEASVSHNAYFMEALTSLVGNLAQYDVALELHSKRNLPAMRTAMLDGVIGVPWDQMSREFLKGMAEKLPCVVFNDRLDESVSSVMSDHWQGGRIAAERFLAKGHRAMSVLVPSMRSFGNAERVRGFVETCAKAGVEIPSSLVFEHPGHSIMDALEATMKAGASAMFFGAFMAGELICSARRMRIKIPDDLSVIVMAEEQIARYQTPPLSSIEQSVDFVGAKAVELLMRKIACPQDRKPEHLLLDAHTFVERDSVKDLS